jgi:2-C-methyl-D-erythritol 4-phosphate cytidylyltransferase
MSFAISKLILLLAELIFCSLFTDPKKILGIDEKRALIFGLEAEKPKHNINKIVVIISDRKFNFICIIKQSKNPIKTIVENVKNIATRIIKDSLVLNGLKSPLKRMTEKYSAGIKKIPK